MTNNIENGDLVKIIGIDKTHRRFDSAPPMHRMVGKEYEVEEVIEKQKIRIYDPESERAYVWDPLDLELVTKILDIKSEAMPDNVLFDPKDL